VFAPAASSNTPVALDDGRMDKDDESGRFSTAGFFATVDTIQTEQARKENDSDSAFGGSSRAFNGLFLNIHSPSM
jgi:hypothetical protein